VGPQPKGNIIKGLCFQKRKPFLFGVILGQVPDKFLPGFVFFEEKEGLIEVKGWDC
jgi:hypothetical protein